MIEYQFTPAGDSTEALSKLYELVHILRGPNGCPYDRAQTERSSLGNLVDESYEYLEAVIKEDKELCKEELGDVLLNVFSLLQIHEDKSDFTTADVINDVCRKLIRRHPHVFGDADAGGDMEKGLDIYMAAKEAEGGHKNSIKEVLDHISSGMPPLEKSYEIQKKLSRIGFDWECVDDVIDKIYEELDEVKEAIKEGGKEHIEDELGDVFSCLVVLSKWLKIRPDQAVERANNKLTGRFIKLSEICKERGIPIDKDHIEEMNQVWDEVKEAEN